VLEISYFDFNLKNNIVVFGYGPLEKTGKMGLELFTAFIDIGRQSRHLGFTFLIGKMPGVLAPDTPPLSPSVSFGHAYYALIPTPQPVVDCMYFT
jgi:hypothetical protein